MKIRVLSAGNVKSADGSVVIFFGGLCIDALTEQVRVVSPDRTQS